MIQKWLQHSILGRQKSRSSTRKWMEFPATIHERRSKGGYFSTPGIGSHNFSGVGRGTKCDERTYTKMLVKKQHGQRWIMKYARRVRLICYRRGWLVFLWYYMLMDTIPLEPVETTNLDRLPRMKRPFNWIAGMDSGFGCWFDAHMRC